MVKTVEFDNNFKVDVVAPGEVYAAYIGNSSKTLFTIKDAGNGRVKVELKTGESDIPETVAIRLFGNYVLNTHNFVMDYEVEELETFKYNVIRVKEGKVVSQGIVEACDLYEALNSFRHAKIPAGLVSDFEYDNGLFRNRKTQEFIVATKVKE